MDCGARCAGGRILEALPAAGRRGASGGAGVGVGSRIAFSGSLNFQTVIGRRYVGSRKQPRLTIKAKNAESNKFCESRNVGSPLEPQSPAGILLKSVLKNQPHLFHLMVAKELEELASERDGAIARREYSLSTPEACLHNGRDQVHIT